MTRVNFMALSLFCLAACGAGAQEQPPAVAPDVEARAATGSPEPIETATAAVKPAKDPSARLVPKDCKQEGDLCLPPAAFVKELCAGYYPDVALQMFGPSAPFTRGYLTRNTEAWNASGGASSSGTLVFDEEVIVLTRREPATSGVIVSGSTGSYDVMRWDGSCASLMGEELTLKRPPSAKAAPISWKSLSQPMREALSKDERIEALDSERRRECKGVSFGEVSKKCETADRALVNKVIAYVRGGGSVPVSRALPE